MTVLAGCVCWVVVVTVCPLAFVYVVCVGGVATDVCVTVVEEVVPGMPGGGAETTCESGSDSQPANRASEPQMIATRATEPVRPASDERGVLLYNEFILPKPT
jgi:hypothetical protein